MRTFGWEQSYLGVQDYYSQKLIQNIIFLQREKYILWNEVVAHIIEYYNLFIFFNFMLLYINIIWDYESAFLYLHL